MKRESYSLFFLFEEWKLMNKTDEKSRGRKKKRMNIDRYTILKSTLKI